MVTSTRVGHCLSQEWEQLQGLPQGRAWDLVPAIWGESSSVFGVIGKPGVTWKGSCGRHVYCWAQKSHGHRDFEK